MTGGAGDNLDARAPGDREVAAASRTEDPQANGPLPPAAPPPADPLPAVPRMSGAEYAFVAVLVAAAFALRLIYILQYRSSPTFDHPVMDPLYHVEWARAFAQGLDYMAGESYFRAPLYPWFLGICFELFGENLLVPRILQALAGAATCGLVYLVGRRLFRRATAAAAALVAATYWLLIYFSAELLIESLAPLLNLVLIWLLVLADERRGWKLFALGGVAMGVSAIARPNILLFGLAACIWIIIRDRRRPARGVLHAFLFGAACLLPIIPITVRNAVEGGDSVLISSQGGVNFYIGNNEVSDGSYAIVPGARPDWWGCYYDSIALAKQAEGRDLKPSEVSRHYFRKGLAFILESPGKWLALTWRKVTYFWNAVEIQNNQPIRFFAERYGSIVRWLPVGFGLISPLAILGLALFLRKPGRLFPLWGFACFYAASVILFFVSTRFRIPMSPILILAACEAVRWTISAAAGSRWLRAGAVVLAAAPLVWWTNTPPEGHINADFQGHLICGEILLREGKIDAGIEELREGIRAEPEFAGLTYMLGLALYQKGDMIAAELAAQGLPAAARAAKEQWYAEAERQFRRTFEQRKLHSRGYWGRAAFMLYKIAAFRKDLEAAVEHLRDAVRLDPFDADARCCLGHALAARGEVEEGEVHLRSALAIKPGMSQAHFDLARVLALKRLDDESLAHLCEALRLDPGNAAYQDYAISFLKDRGRAKEALRILEDALSRLPPGSPAAESLSRRIADLRAKNQP